MEKLNLAAGPKFPPAYQQLAFRYQIGTLLLEEKTNLDPYACLVAPPDMKIPDFVKGKKKPVIPADSHLAESLEKLLPHASNLRGDLHTDTETGSAQIITPRSETFMMPASLAEAKGSVASVSGNDSVSLCFVGSLDRQPLPKANRILALYLTDLKNSDMEIEREPKENVVVHQLGHLPLLIRQGTITFSFQMKRHILPRVWALKQDGTRAVELEVTPRPGGFAFQAKAVTSAEVFSAFELAWE